MRDEKPAPQGCPGATASGRATWEGWGGGTYLLLDFSRGFLDCEGTSGVIDFDAVAREEGGADERFFRTGQRYADIHKSAIPLCLPCKDEFLFDECGICQF